MPKVVVKGKKTMHFPYTEKGMEQAKKAKKKLKKGKKKQNLTVHQNIF